MLAVHQSAGQLTGGFTIQLVDELVAAKGLMLCLAPVVESCCIKMSMALTLS